MIGKPLGIVGVSLLVTRLSRRRLRPPVGWAAVLGGGTIAGVGFTVSLLVATLAFDGTRLEEAKVGICARPAARRPSHGSCSGPRHCCPGGNVSRRCSVATSRWSISPTTSTPSAITSAGDSTRRSPSWSTATSSVRTAAAQSRRYASCCATSPTCATSGDTCHCPTCTPDAELEVKGSEAAAAQGAFWPMHDVLLEHQDALRIRGPRRYADSSGSSRAARWTRGERSNGDDAPEARQRRRRRVPRPPAARARHAARRARRARVAGARRAVGAHHDAGEGRPLGGRQRELPALVRARLLRDRVDVAYRPARGHRAASASRPRARVRARPTRSFWRAASRSRWCRSSGASTSRCSSRAT